MQTKIESLFTSRIIAVKLQDRTFHLHSSLLCQHSERFKKSLTGSFQEATKLEIELIDEDVNCFVHFASYLYQSPNAIWKPTYDKDSKIMKPCMLAAIYAMGERLLANDFQRIILRTFTKHNDLLHLGIADLCTLCNEITARPHPDDPMRALIFELAASKLSGLQNNDTFRQMLKVEDGLAEELCLRAGNGPAPVNDASKKRRHD